MDTKTCDFCGDKMNNISNDMVHLEIDSIRTISIMGILELGKDGSAYRKDMCLKCIDNKLKDKYAPTGS